MGIYELLWTLSVMLLNHKTSLNFVNHSIHVLTLWINLYKTYEINQISTNAIRHELKINDNRN